MPTFKHKSAAIIRKSVRLNTTRFPAVKHLFTPRLCHHVYTLSIRPHIAHFLISFLSRNPLSIFRLFWHSSLVSFPSAVFDWAKKKTDLFTEGQSAHLTIVHRKNHHSCVCLITMETVLAGSSQTSACEQLQKQKEP